MSTVSLAESRAYLTKCLFRPHVQELEPPRTMCQKIFDFMVDLVAKVSKVVFHILTLGIVWLVRRSVINQEITYGKQGREAIAFAKKKLEKHPDIQPIKFSRFYGPINKQPVDPRIGKLTALLLNGVDKLSSLLDGQNDSKTAWEDPKVVKQAGKNLKLAFAISSLSLEDLPAFGKAHRVGRESFKKALNEEMYNQDSHYYKSLYFCSIVYHQLVRGIPEDGDRPGYKIFKSSPVEENFYDNSKQEHEYRVLYNEFCDIIKPSFDYEGLCDPRLESWYDRDDKKESFKPIPDSLPT